MARKYFSLFKKPQNDSARSCEIFGPLRISESQSTKRKAATVEKVMGISQSSSQLKLYLEEKHNKQSQSQDQYEICKNAQLQIEMVKYM